jgi:hypothetical protein
VRAVVTSDIAAFAVMTLRTRRGRRPEPRVEGLKQLDAYLHRSSRSEGTLMLFDRCKAAPPLESRVVDHHEVGFMGKSIRVWRGESPRARTRATRKKDRATQAMQSAAVNAPR